MIAERGKGTPSLLSNSFFKNRVYGTRLHIPIRNARKLAPSVAVGERRPGWAADTKKQVAGFTSLRFTGIYPGVDQFGRSPDLGSGGHRFESCYSDLSATGSHSGTLPTASVGEPV